MIIVLGKVTEETKGNKPNNGEGDGLLPHS